VWALKIARAAQFASSLMSGDNPHTADQGVEPHQLPKNRRFGCQRVYAQGGAVVHDVAVQPSPAHFVVEHQLCLGLLALADPRRQKGGKPADG
jgi:hypothetical protein